MLSLWADIGWVAWTWLLGSMLEWGWQMSFATLVGVIGWAITPVHVFLGLGLGLELCGALLTPQQLMLEALALFVYIETVCLWRWSGEWHVLAVPRAREVGIACYLACGWSAWGMVFFVPHAVDAWAKADIFWYESLNKRAVQETRFQEVVRSHMTMEIWIGSTLLKYVSIMIIKVCSKMYTVTCIACGNAVTKVREIPGRLFLKWLSRIYGMKRVWPSLINSTMKPPRKVEKQKNPRNRIQCGRGGVPGVC